MKKEKLCEVLADTRQQQNEKNDLKPIVVNVGSPRDLPVGTLTRCLFGISIDELAAEISANKNGKWNDVYT